MIFFTINGNEAFSLFYKFIFMYIERERYTKKLIYFDIFYKNEICKISFDHNHNSMQ